MYFESGVIDYNIVLEDIAYFLVFLCMLWNECVFLASEQRIYCDTNLKDSFEKKQFMICSIKICNK